MRAGLFTPVVRRQLFMCAYDNGSPGAERAFECRDDVSLARASRYERRSRQTIISNDSGTGSKAPQIFTFNLGLLCKDARKREGIITAAAAIVPNGKMTDGRARQEGAQTGPETFISRGCRHMFTSDTL